MQLFESMLYESGLSFVYKFVQFLAEMSSISPLCMLCCSFYFNTRVRRGCVTIHVNAFNMSH